MKKIHFGFDMYPHAFEFFTFCGVEIDYVDENEKYISDKENKLTCKKCRSTMQKMLNDGMK